VPYSNCAPSRTKSLVQTLLERGCDGDLAEAEAAIDRMENRPFDFRWAARDIAVLLLRALQSHGRGEEAAYQDLAQRYRAIANITWL
jgi:adenylate cyclase